jgi:adenosine deaminase
MTICVRFFAKLLKHNVPFTINTDGPEMMQTNLLEEYRRLLVNNILTEENLLRANETARKASFI